MINKSLLNSINDIDGIYKNLSIIRQEVGNFIICRNDLNNYVELHDNSSYPSSAIMIDACNFIKLYAKRIIEIDYNSVLFVGLGLGIFPYLSQDTTQDIDVVEINQDIISMNNNMSHLKNNVNIINADIYTYATTKTYDLIVFDIWNEKGVNFLQQTQQLSTLFSSNLNVGGEIHFPLLNFAS